MDPNSKDLSDLANKKFVDDKSMMDKVNNTLKVSSVDSRKYGAVLYPGGHGPMFDLADDEHSHKVAREVYERGGVLIAVCHGPAAIAKLKLSNGKYLVEGKRVTGFSNAEEAAVDLTSAMPFLLESVLIENGGKFEKADLWQSKVVVDGRLITGQNPASAKGVGEALVKSLSAVKQ
jgi:putative intracellular protease/amidase